MKHNILVAAIGANITLFVFGVAAQNIELCLLALVSSSLCLLPLINYDEE